MPMKVAHITAGQRRISGGVEPRDCERVVCAGFRVDVWQERRGEWVASAAERTAEMSLDVRRYGPSHPTKCEAIAEAGRRIGAANR